MNNYDTATAAADSNHGDSAAYTRGLTYATLAQVDATDRLTAVIKDFLDYVRAEDQAAVAALEKARAVV